MRTRCAVWFVSSILSGIILVFSSSASGTILNFERFDDSTLLTNQIIGVAFSSTTVITAGITLNEFEFPPAA